MVPAGGRCTLPLWAAGARRCGAFGPQRHPRARRPTGARSGGGRGCPSRAGSTDARGAGWPAAPTPARPAACADDLHGAPGAQGTSPRPTGQPKSSIEITDRGGMPDPRSGASVPSAVPTPRARRTWRPSPAAGRRAVATSHGRRSSRRRSASDEARGGAPASASSRTRAAAAAAESRRPRAGPAASPSSDSASSGTAQSSTSIQDSMPLEPPGFRPATRRKSVTGSTA